MLSMPGFGRSGPDSELLAYGQQLMAYLGFSPLWLGVLTTVNSEIGTISPPSGLVLFAMKGLMPKGFTTRDLFVGVMPFVGLLLAFLVVMIAFPQASTWLPSHMK